MTNNCFFLFGFLFLFQSFYGQIEEKELKKMSYDELKKGFLENSNNKELQIKYSDTYLDKAKVEKNNSMLAKGYYMKSILNDSYKSINYLDSVIIFSKKVNNTKDLKIAFFEKAGKLENEKKFKLAIESYINAENLAKKDNDSNYFYEAKFSIALIKSEDMGEINEALDLYRECYTFYKKNKNKKQKYYRTYLNINFAIADAHRALNQLDSSSFYNKSGYKEAILFNDERLKGCFILNEGATQCLKNNFKIALDSLDKALPIMIKHNNKMNQIASYFYYAKSYEGLNKIDLALKYFEKVDSIYKNIKYITPEFVNGYHFLIKYYKNKENKEKQLYYLNTMMTIDSTFQINYKELTKKLSKDYDIPLLIKEKEIIINELESGKRNNYYIIASLFFSVLIFLIFGIIQTRLKKTYKLRFEELVNKNVSTSTFDEKSNKEKASEDLNISDDIIQIILKELKDFEKNKLYLNPNISVQSLANDFNTNSRYLSAIINAKKQKTFVNYINDLRIDNIVKELKSNTILRKYTMKAISEEAGFKTAESFSKAFFKRTGLKPSYFIKELEKI